MRAYEGPTVVPFSSMGSTHGTPHNPALYGRYIVIDLDANNRASIEAWLERNPGREHVPFGYGVCRQGFGLQEFGDGTMSEETALARATALNDNMPIGEIERPQDAKRRVKLVAELIPNERSTA